MNLFDSGNIISQYLFPLGKNPGGVHLVRLSFSSFDDDDANALVFCLLLFLLPACIKCTQNELELTAFIQVFLSDALSCICSWNYTAFIDCEDADCGESTLLIVLCIGHFVWA